MTTHNLLRTLDLREGGTGAPSLFTQTGHWRFVSGPVDPFITVIDGVSAPSVAIGDLIRHPNTNVLLSDPGVEFDPAVPGKYIFEYVENIDEVETVTSLSIDIIDPLVLAIMQSDIERCLIGTTSTVIDLNGVPTFLVGGGVYTDPVTYQWYLNGNPIAGQTSKDFSYLLASSNPDIETTYIFELRACGEPCDNVSAFVTVVLSPYVFAGDFNDMSVCEGTGANYDLRALVNGGSFAEFDQLSGGTELWTDVDGILPGLSPGDPIPDPTDVDLSAVVPGIYTFTRLIRYTFASAQMCDDLETLTLTIALAGVAGTGAAIIVCNGCAARSMQICPDC